MTQAVQGHTASTHRETSRELPRLVFRNTFFDELPRDSENGLRRRHVLGACSSPVAPTPVTQPRLVAYSPDVAQLLGWSCSHCETEEFAAVFGGNAVLPGMATYAACYGGHQFGSWAGQLGDGRAIGLGEVEGPAGRWELQLKGAGPTPYSRTADGRAVLRSSLREFLCSEAMFHLGVPTTRALSLVLTGERVVRDMFYDGRPKAEPGAVVCRVAPSFLRFGSFEIFAARQDPNTLRKLIGYAAKHHFPECVDRAGNVDVGALFETVCVRTAHLMAAWMSFGFVHGVMNTDNMSLLGLTIDYGPYGWLDDFDPDWTPNTSDTVGRRYRFRFQPRIGLWNLVRLAEALAPAVAKSAELERGLDRYQTEYRLSLSKRLHAKLGLAVAEVPGSDEGGRDSAFGCSTGDPLVDDLGSALTSTGMDMTLFFRLLSQIRPEHSSANEQQLVGSFESALYSPLHQISDQAKSELSSWLRRYAEQVSVRALPEREKVMSAANPAFVLRNYLTQAAIEAMEQGDDSRLQALLCALRSPYDEATPAALRGRRPDWARYKPGCSALSCSS